MPAEAAQNQILRHHCYLPSLHVPLPIRGLEEAAISGQFPAV